jgi:hypothetical protein
MQIFRQNYIQFYSKAHGDYVENNVIMTDNWSRFLTEMTKYSFTEMTSTCPLSFRIFRDKKVE